MSKNPKTEAEAEPFVLVTRPVPGVAVLTLNRPKILNALTALSALEIRERVLELNKDETVRCVMLTGSGRGFCSGANLSAGSTGDLIKKDENGQPIRLGIGQGIAYNMEHAYNPATRALYELDKPLVVAVNGTAAGGGVGLALIGDVILAAESAKFINTFASGVGLAPDLGTTWMLPRLIGRGRAMSMSLLAEPISAKEAERIGMIYKCVPDAELQAQALAIAQKLAAGPTIAFVETRKLLDASWMQTLPRQLDAELKAQSDLGDMPDFTIAIRRFRGKGKEPFTGQRGKL